MSATDIKHIPWVTVVLGVIILTVGLTVAAVPAIEEAVPISEALTALVAVIVIGLGIWRVRVRYSASPKHVDLPIPELPFAQPTPGDDLDEMIYRYVHRGEKTIEYPEQIGNRLREVAIQVISHREECTREDAIEILEEGSWTDDRQAAAYFSSAVGPAEKSLIDRISGIFSRGDNKTPYERQVEATVDAIVNAATIVDDADPKSPTDEDDDGGLLSRLRGSGDQNSPVLSNRKSVLEYGGSPNERSPGGVYYGDTVWTGRWIGIESLALLAAGVGVLTAQPGLIMVGAVIVAYAAYPRLEGRPSIEGLAVERTIDNDNPLPGEEVTVSVTVTNESGTLMPDLRLIDLVPPNMTVIDGSPRVYTPLRPGAEVTFHYTAIAERGTHKWPLLAVASGFSATVEREGVIDVDDSLECLPRLRTVADVPVRAQTTVYEGQVNTSIGGSGLEFHSVREYLPTDPMRRVEWKRLARTGELATIDFREERAANVVLLFDAREGAYVSHSPGSRHALDRSVDAAMEVYAALADKGDLVGIAAFDTVPCWLGPGAGTGHHEEARRMFANHPAISSLPPELLDLEGGYVDPMNHVRRQLPSGAQVMLFSSMISDYVVDVARQLDSAGHLVTVVSPNPTAARTPGQRLARVERATRINRVRNRGIRVVDWEPNESLNLTFKRARQRWAV